jgi:glutathione-independent formaldehyde dehydrogenase
MKAVVYEDTRRVGVQEVDDAVVEDPGDVVVRVTSSAICGTDLHMYDGRTGAEPGLVLGHEPLGVVEEMGPAVTLLRQGERVVVPTHLFCGLCFNCIRGYTAACLRVRPGSFGAAYGYAGMGPTAARRPSCCGCRMPTPTASPCRASPATSVRTTSSCWRTRS